MRYDTDEVFLRDQILRCFTEKELLCELIRRVFSIGGPIQHRGTLAKRGLEDLSIAFGYPEIMGIEVNPPLDDLDFRDYDS